jgi:hypothetical protein
MMIGFCFKGSKVSNHAEGLLDDVSLCLSSHVAFAWPLFPE